MGIRRMESITNVIISSNNSSHQKTFFHPILTHISLVYANLKENIIQYAQYAKLLSLWNTSWLNTHTKPL